MRRFLFAAAALFAAAGLRAGDLAELNFVGFSEDGARFAYEQFGVQDGSGFGYSQIYFVDAAKNAWAGPPVAVEDEKGESLEAVRARARKAAEPSLQKFGGEFTESGGGEKPPHITTLILGTTGKFGILPKGEIQKVGYVVVSLKRLPDRPKIGPGVEGAVSQGRFIYTNLPNINLLVWIGMFDPHLPDILSQQPSPVVVHVVTSPALPATTRPGAPRPFLAPIAS